MTKSRIFLFLLLAFVGGVALRSVVVVPLIFIWAGTVVAVAVIASGILKKQKYAVLYGFLFLSFIAGVFRFFMAENLKPDLTAFYGKPVALRAVVVEEPEQKEITQHIKVETKSLLPRFYILVTTRKYPEYKIGDELEIEGLLKRPENYGEFDYVSYLAKEDIYSIISFPLVEKVGEGRGNRLKIFLSQAKRSFENKITRVLPEPHASFLKGLLLGERESLPQDLVENFNRTGTTHIVALSGYNITTVGRVFIAVLLLLTVPFRFSFWLATLGIVLFVMLTGASPSVVRAGIMGILVLVANREGRLYQMTNALVFAGAVMILQNPRILRFDAAFQLSFLATAGLIYLSPHTERFFDRICDKFRAKLSLARKKEVPDKHKLFQFKQILVETLSAQLAVLPLLVYLFGRVSLISPLSNLLVLLAVPYAMGLGFITGVSGFLWMPLSQIMGWVTWVMLEYKISVIELLAKLPLAQVKLGKVAVIPLLALYIYASWRIFITPQIKKRAS